MSVCEHTGIHTLFYCMYRISNVNHTKITSSGYRKDEWGTEQTESRMDHMSSSGAEKKKKLFFYLNNHSHVSPVFIFTNIYSYSSTCWFNLRLKSWSNSIFALDIITSISFTNVCSYTQKKKTWTFLIPVSHPFSTWNHILRAVNSHTSVCMCVHVHMCLI